MLLCFYFFSVRLSSRRPFPVLSPLRNHTIITSRRCPALEGEVTGAVVLLLFFRLSTRKNSRQKDCIPLPSGIISPLPPAPLVELMFFRRFLPCGEGHGAGPHLLRKAFPARVRRGVFSMPEAIWLADMAKLRIIFECAKRKRENF